MPITQYRLLLLALVSLLLVVACGGGSEGTDPVSRGAQIYARSGCATCHGDKGHGDGPSAASMSIKPRDFTKPGEFHTARTVEAVGLVIQQGSGNGVMPAYAFLSDEERKDLASFVLSLAGGAQ